MITWTDTKETCYLHVIFKEKKKNPQKDKMWIIAIGAYETSISPNININGRRLSQRCHCDVLN